MNTMTSLKDSLKKRNIAGAFSEDSFKKISLNISAEIPSIHLENRSGISSKLFREFCQKISKTCLHKFLFFFVQKIFQVFIWKFSLGIASEIKKN